MRYLRAAGAKDYALAKNFDEFSTLVDNMPDRTDIIVFKNRFLPLRGVVNEKFINKARALVADGEEYLYGKLLPSTVDDIRSFGAMSDTHGSMAEDLHEHLGESVAIGPCPPFNDPDNELMISASKGGIDGLR